MPLSETVLFIMALLTVAMIAAGLCRNLPLPYTVVLVIVGMALGELSRHQPALAPLAEFRLSPELVFYIFLPALIFESALNLDVRQLVKDLPAVLVLAIPALLISTAMVGIGLRGALGVELIIALMFGALISATDPVAVITLFKELGAPARMTVLVEGESLLNDATAIVVFGVLLGLAARGGGLGAEDLGLAVLDFLEVFLGGALVGAAAGAVLSELLRRLQANLGAVLTLTLVAAYASFIIAEHLLHVSGVMASAAAAIILGVLGIARLPQQATGSVGETWELVALICNSLLFLMLGLSVEPGALLSQAGPIGVAVLLVLAARAAAVYGLIPVTTRMFSLPRVHLRERHIMWWGGLKGGLAIAIALSIPASLPGRQILLDMTLGVVLFTLLVNATTIRRLMSLLGLDALTDDERSERDRSLAKAARRAAAVLERFRATGVLSPVSQRRVQRTLEEALGGEAGVAEPHRAAREVYLAALGEETAELDRLHELGVVSHYTFLEMRSLLQSDREAHAAGQEAARSAGRARAPIVRLEMSLLRRLREHDWAAGLLAWYQNLRLAHHLEHNIAGILICESVLAALEARTDLDAREREAAADTFRERLARRRERVELVCAEFPDFYRSFEARLFTSVALEGALQLVEHEHRHGGVGAKAFTRIERGLLGALAELPPITAPLPKLTPHELVSMIPLFAGLSEHALEAMAKRAHPVTFLPGDIVIGEGERGDALYIITRGKVSVFRTGADGGQGAVGALAEGDFFGEMALLGDQMRTASVVACTPATLLRLTRHDVLGLAAAHPEIGARLEQGREARASPP